MTNTTPTQAPATDAVRCPEKLKPGGCQLHNLHCGWPACNKPPATDALPNRDTTKPAEQQGLFLKFNVCRTDGSDAPGGKHHGCEYFVLDVAHDAHAKAALAAYAEACKSTHPELAADMVNRYALASQAPTQAPSGDAGAGAVPSEALAELQGMWDFIDREKTAHPKMMRDWSAALTVIEDALKEPVQWEDFEVHPKTSAELNEALREKARALAAPPLPQVREQAARPTGGVTIRLKLDPESGEYLSVHPGSPAQPPAKLLPMQANKAVEEAMLLAQRFADAVASRRVLAHRNPSDERYLEEYTVSKERKDALRVFIRQALATKATQAPPETPAALPGVSEALAELVAVVRDHNSSGTSWHTNEQLCRMMAALSSADAALAQGTSQAAAPAALSDQAIADGWKAWPRTAITSAERAIEFIRFAEKLGAEDGLR